MLFADQPVSIAFVKFLHTGRHEMDHFEFYGNQAQVNLQQRCYRLWSELKANPRFSFVGRAIGLDDPGLEDVEGIIDLTTELGFLSLAFTKSTIVDELCSALETHGLKTGIWQHLLSTQKTKSRCHSLEASLHLTPEYRIERISMATSPDLLHQVQELMQSCGVAPLPGYILRGQEIPTLAEFVITPLDEVVATGAGIFRHNPAGPYGKAAHVGLLATEQSHRGKGFARLLLARIILACYDEFGAEFVHTGVRTDNIPSQRVCSDCGLADSGMYFVGVFYPQIMEQAEFTR
jgi:RimJ/RimL family protein N-acetyltransferase